MIFNILFGCHLLLTTKLSANQLTVTDKWDVMYLYTVRHWNNIQEDNDRCTTRRCFHILQVHKDFHHHIRRYLKAKKACNLHLFNSFNLARHIDIENILYILSNDEIYDCSKYLRKCHRHLCGNLLYNHIWKAYLYLKRNVSKR